MQELLANFDAIKEYLDRYNRQFNNKGVMTVPRSRITASKEKYSSVEVSPGRHHNSKLDH